MKILNRASVLCGSMGNLNWGAGIQNGKKKVDWYFRYIRWH